MITSPSKRKESYSIQKLYIYIQMPEHGLFAVSAKMFLLPFETGNEIFFTCYAWYIKPFPISINFHSILTIHQKLY